MNSSAPPDDFDDELLSAFIDDELSTAERARVESWLETDSSAQRRVDELRSLSTAVKNIPLENIPANIREIVDETLKSSSSQVAASADSKSVESFDRNAAQRGFGRGIAWATFAIAATLLLTFWLPDQARDQDGSRLAGSNDRTDAPSQRDVVSGSAIAESDDGRREIPEFQEAPPIAKSDSSNESIAAAESFSAAAEPATPSSDVEDADQFGDVASNTAMAPRHSRQANSSGASADDSSDTNTQLADSVAPAPDVLTEIEQSESVRRDTRSRQAFSNEYRSYALSRLNDSQSLEYLRQLKPVVPSGAQLSIVQMAGDAPREMNQAFKKFLVESGIELTAPESREPRETEGGRRGTSTAAENQQTIFLVTATPQEIAELIARCIDNDEVFSSVAFGRAAAPGAVDADQQPRTDAPAVGQADRRATESRVNLQSLVNQLSQYANQAGREIHPRDAEHSRAVQLDLYDGRSNEPRDSESSRLTQQLALQSEYVLPLDVQSDQSTAEKTSGVDQGSEGDRQHTASRRISIIVSFESDSENSAE